ncbi:MAG: rod shape-determining protein [Planctomycetota bacterium]
MLSQIFRRLKLELALDLGTVNTLVAVPGEGVVVDEPAVVAVERATGKPLADGTAVGRLARQMEGRTPESIEVVRPMKDGVVADYVLCEALVRHVLRKAAPPGFSLRPAVVVGVPGGITRVERRAVFNSLQRAGARSVWLIQEAAAAALGAALPIAEPAASMICDIGGGTTEIAVLSLGEIVAWQSIRCGGDAMDQAIAGYLRRRHALRVGLPTAERLKIEIGSAEALDEERTLEVTGSDIPSGLPRRSLVSSEEVRHAMAEPLDRILDALKLTIEHLRPEMAEDLLARGLVLCGGGALLRRLPVFLREQTGLPVRMAEEPMTTVARGLLVGIEQRDAWRHLLSSSDDA